MSGNYCNFCNISSGPRDRSCPNCMRPFSSANRNSKPPLELGAKNHIPPENTKLIQSFNQNLGILERPILCVILKRYC